MERMNQNPCVYSFKHPAKVKNTPKVVVTTNHIS
jgi:hypothetical protein